MKKILVPVDGSELSLKVVEQALDYAKNQESIITLLTVVYAENIYFGDFMPSYGQSQSMIEAQKTVFEESKKNAAKMLDILAEKFEEKNIPVEKIVKSGRAAERIIETAESGHYDLIIIGNRGFSPAKKFLLGSVSQRVLSEVKCPVLVTKKQ